MCLYPKSLPVRIREKHREIIPAFLHIADIAAFRDRRAVFFCVRRRSRMDYPVIDPAGTGANIRKLIRNNGKTVTETAGFLGLADKSTMYKWIRGDALPGIDNLFALSIFLGVTVNDILAAR